MIKLIVGTNGTGKTKTLIEMAKKAAEEEERKAMSEMTFSFDEEE